jgi:hypothetical protein
LDFNGNSNAFNIKVQEKEKVHKRKKRQKEKNLDNSNSFNTTESILLNVNATKDQSSIEEFNNNKYGNFY